MKEFVIEFVDSREDYDRMVKEVGQSKKIFLDLETTGLDHSQDRIRTLTIAGESGPSWVINWNKDDMGKRALADLVDPSVVLVAQNVKFEYRWINEFLLFGCKQWHDTLLMSKIVNPLHTDHSLEAIAERWVTPDAFRAKNAISVKELQELPITTEKFLLYAGTDVLLTREIYNKLLEQINTLQLHNVAILEHELLPTIIKIEDKGIRVDKNMCNLRGALHINRSEEILADLTKNGLGSMGAAKIAEYLYEVTNNPIVFNGDGGPDTGDKILEQLDHSEAIKILQVRRLRKLANTYYNKFATESDDEGILHATFNQLGARTGRMSGARPNLQNVPVGERIPDDVRLGYGPREAIIARPGNKLISADYSQIEPRIAARLSQDEQFIAACSGGDVYSGIHTNRSTAKMLVLAVTYGAGNDKLAQQSGMSIAEVEGALGDFASNYPKLIRYRDKLISQVSGQAKKKQECYVASMIGRRTWMQPSERHTKALNGVIQSTAGDVLKQAIIDADKAGISKYFVSLVHDEIIADVPSEEVDEFRSTLKDVMEDRTEQPHYLADSVVGNNYAEIK